MLHVLLNLLLTTVLAATRDDPPTSLHDADLRDLSLLPIDRLLAVRRALSYKDIDPPESPANSSGTVAQALRGDPGTRGTPPPRRGGPQVWVEEVDVWQGGGGGGGWKAEGGGWKGGGGKGKGALQGIFQGTVTVLAFLAFGGYLLCLVLNALKQKEAALEMTLLTTVAPATRRRRALQLDRVERLYTTLRALSEAYAKYDQGCVHD